MGQLMHRLALFSLLFATLLLSGCSLGGTTFALMRDSTWRVAPGGTAYALEVRPGGRGIIYRINGDAVSEELRAPAAELALLGLLGDDLVVRTGGAGGPLLRIRAAGGSAELSAADAIAVADIPPAFCGPFVGVVEGGTAPAAGCLVGTAAYLFTDSGLLFRVKDGIATQVDPDRYRDRSGRAGLVVELHSLSGRIWIGTVTSPADVVQYTSISEPATP
jgi:hypothetical protein